MCASIFWVAPWLEWFYEVPELEFEEPTSGLTGVASSANLFSLTFLLRDLLEFLEESLARRLSRSESLLCLLFSESMDWLGGVGGTVRGGSGRG